MKHNISQEEIRRIIINDMVKKRNTIVPVIGDDVIVYKNPDTLQEMPFQEFILHKFMEKYPDVEAPESDIVSMRERGYYGMSLMSQYYEYRFLDDYMDFVNENRSSIKLKDEVFDFLITFNFPIIITTFCFDILEQQLQGKIDNYKSVWYKPNKENRALPSRCVYHIFGQATYGSKWVSDEDLLLTFLLSHNNKEFGAIELTAYLKENSKNLFALGCNLPNWLFRFFWQPTQAYDPNTKTTQGYWINKEKPEDSFENFLRKKNFSTTKQVKDILVNATKLLQTELQKEAELQESRNSSTDHFDVFLSYASEDRQIATVIFEALRNMNITVWFDNRGKGEITPGSPYWEKIKNGIKHSAHFMPLITGNWMHKLINTSSLKEETYLVRDWHAECNKSDNPIQLQPNYSIPVIVKGSSYNGVDINEGYIEQLAGFGVLPKTLFNGIDMISFDEKDMSIFDKIEW